MKPEQSPIDPKKPRRASISEPSFDFEKAEREAAAEVKEVDRIKKENGYDPDEILVKKNGRWYDKNGNPVRNKRFDGVREDPDSAYRGPNG